VKPYSPSPTALMKCFPALHALAVHPDYQGRGCASMLVRWGIEKADASVRKCYLESTPVAYDLYCKHSWVTVDEIVLGLKKYGGHEHKIMIMMREPRAVTS